MQKTFTLPKTTTVGEMENIANYLESNNVEIVNYKVNGNVVKICLMILMDPPVKSYLSVKQIG